MSNNYQVITTLNLKASGNSGSSGTFDIDLFNIPKLNLLFTASTALTVVMQAGPGNGDPGNYTSGMPIVLGGSSIPKYETTGSTYNLAAGSKSFAFFRELMPRWLRVTVSNTSPIAATSVLVEGDI